MSHHAIPKRSEVELLDTWKLEDIFSTDEEVKQAITAAYTMLKGFSQYRGKVTENAHTLYEALEDASKANELMEKIYVYSHMRLHQDGSNSFYQDLSSLSEKLMIEGQSQMSFLSPELSTLTEETVDRFIETKSELKLYKRELSEILRQKEHILDPQMEEVLSQFAEVAHAPSNIYAMFNNADIKFPVIENEKGDKVQLTLGRYIEFMESHSQDVRKGAFTALYETYSSFKNTLGTTFAANVAQLSLFSKLRHFNRPIESALDANNIPVAVYDNLIATVNEHLPLIYDYMALRKERLGVDELHMYDLFVPLVKDFTKKITFDEACEIVLAAVAPLGEEYVATVKKAFDERWIDRYENTGKRTGAYSWACYDAPHPYVLMNYTENVNNLFTLAHEMGHAMHSYYSNNAQPYPYASYCIFVAEVASTVNEALLMQYLLKTTTDEAFRKYLVNYFMEQFKSTVYRQTMFAEFEKEMYSLYTAGTTLTTQLISDTYYNLVKKYHGDHVVVDELISMEWARIPHFYTPFYVYQYATGFSAAVALSNRILNDGSEAVEAYLNFLKGGSSQDPIDLLKGAGVDMSSPKPIEEALSVFKGLIEEMKTL